MLPVAHTFWEGFSSDPRDTEAWPNKALRKIEFLVFGPAAQLTEEERWLALRAVNDVVEGVTSRTRWWLLQGRKEAMDGCRV